MAHPDHSPLAIDNRRDDEQTHTSQSTRTHNEADHQHLTNQLIQQLEKFLLQQYNTDEIALSVHRCLDQIWTHVSDHWAKFSHTARDDPEQFAYSIIPDKYTTPLADCIWNYHIMKLTKTANRTTDLKRLYFILSICPNGTSDAIKYFGKNILFNDRNQKLLQTLAKRYTKNTTLKEQQQPNKDHDLPLDTKRYVLSSVLEDLTNQRAQRLSPNTRKDPFFIYTDLNNAVNNKHSQNTTPTDTPSPPAQTIDPTHPVTDDEPISISNEKASDPRSVPHDYNGTSEQPNPISHTNKLGALEIRTGPYPPSPRITPPQTTPTAQPPAVKPRTENARKPLPEQPLRAVTKEPGSNKRSMNENNASKPKRRKTSDTNKPSKNPNSEILTPDHTDASNPNSGDDDTSEPETDTNYSLRLFETNLPMPKPDPNQPDCKLPLHAHRLTNDATHLVTQSNTLPTDPYLSACRVLQDNVMTNEHVLKLFEEYQTVKRSKKWLGTKHYTSADLVDAIFTNGRTPAYWTIGSPGGPDNLTTPTIHGATTTSYENADYLLLTSQQHQDLLSQGWARDKCIIIRDNPDTPPYRPQKSLQRKLKWFENIVKTSPTTEIDAQNPKNKQRHHSSHAIPLSEAIDQINESNQRTMHDTPPMNFIDIQGGFGSAPKGLITHANFLQEVCQAASASTARRPGSNNPTVSATCTNTGVSAIQHFELIGNRGTVSEPHMDMHGAITYATLEKINSTWTPTAAIPFDSIKLWPILPTHSMTKRSEILDTYDMHANDPLRAVSEFRNKIPLILMLTGDTIIMPPGTIHFPISVTTSYMTGGKVWDKSIIKNTIDFWAYAAQTHQVTNELSTTRDSALLAHLQNWLAIDCKQPEPQTKKYTKDNDNQHLMTAIQAIQHSIDNIHKPPPRRNW